MDHQFSHKRSLKKAKNPGGRVSEIVITILEGRRRLQSRWQKGLESYLKFKAQKRQTSNSIWIQIICQCLSETYCNEELVKDIECVMGIKIPDTLIYHIIQLLALQYYEWEFRTPWFPWYCNILSSSKLHRSHKHELSLSQSHLKSSQLDCFWFSKT